MQSETSIIKTLCYADIFDFPMTFNEIHKYLISKEKISKKELKKGLSELLKNRQIKEHNNIYFLRGRKILVNLRKERTLESKSKTVTAKKFSEVIRLIPSVELIGVSGSLAMKNSGKKDDIDFFIITKPNTVWITRFLVQTLVFVFKSKTEDKICPNMYISSAKLKLGKTMQDLFTAHEICQLKVVFDRGKVYKKFLGLNPWIRKYLPNIKSEKTTIRENVLYRLIAPLERLMFFAQYLYMKPKITKEKVNMHQIRFHDSNKGRYVLDLYRIKTNLYLNKKKNTKSIKFIQTGQILQDIDLF